MMNSCSLFCSGLAHGWLFNPRSSSHDELHDELWLKFAPNPSAFTIPKTKKVPIYGTFPMPTFDRIDFFLKHQFQFVELIPTFSFVIMAA